MKNYNEKIMQLEQKEQYKEKKHQVNTKIKTKIIGYLIAIIVFVGFIATTLLSLAGGYEVYQDDLFKLIAFFISFIFIQTVLFITSSLKTIISKNFNKHYSLLILMQIGLLIVSIYYNYMFFAEHNIITFIMCVLLDFSIICFSSLSYDLITTTYSNSNYFDKQQNFIQMFIFNMTIKLKINILRKFELNKRQLEMFSNPAIERNAREYNYVKAEENANLKVLKPGNLFNKRNNKKYENDVIENEADKDSFLGDDILFERDVEELVKCIFENHENYICPSVSELNNLTEFSIKRINEIRKILKMRGILSTRGFKTLINVNDSNEAIKILRGDIVKCSKL